MKILAQCKSTRTFYFYNNYVAFYVTTTQMEKLEIGPRSFKTLTSSRHVVNQLAFLLNSWLSSIVVVYKNHRLASFKVLVSLIQLVM
jgi:hypothetical protein